MSNNAPLIKINDSDKQRPSSILPDTQGHTDGGEAGCGEKMKQHKFKIIAILVVLIVAVILGVTLGGSGDSPSPGPTPPGPDPGPTPTPPEPINTGYNPYYLDDSSMVSTQKNKVSGVLNFNQTVIDDGAVRRQGLSEDINITLTPNQIPTGANNAYIQNVSYDFSQVDYKITKVLFSDSNKTRYSIPESLVGSMPDRSNMSLNTAGFKMFQDPFGFEFRSTRQPNVVNVHTNGSDFVMTDKFMQLDLQMPSGRIYGLGERQREFSLVPGTWTMWANGRETPYDDGTGGKQTYGVHPFALVQTQQKDEWMGIFFRNSNVQSPIITNKTDGNFTLTYVSTGGQLEMYFFTKGSSKEIIQAYHNLIGKPALTPFWSMGWHAASYDYKDLASYEKVIADYKSHGIPLEGVFFDIPYLSDGADFSVNSKTFPNLKTWSQNLKKNNQKLTVIIDGGISADDFENQYFSHASNQKVLLKSSVNPGWLTQHVWSKKSVFLDFMNEQAALIWMTGINNLFDEVEYDGLWLDMNEATGFCDGECVDGTVPQPPSAKQNKRRSLKEQILENAQDFVNEEIFGDEKNMTWYNSWSDGAGGAENSTYKLPFSPGPDNMDHMSLSLNATHVDGSTEYNLHSLFGHSEGMQTHRILTNETYNKNLGYTLKDKRTFLLSRSTFAGSGKYVQHSLGENHRNWQSMKWSIAGVMNFNMFGIPMVGPDTCGFFEDQALNQTEQRELCARWIQLSAFYPFARQNYDTATLPEGMGLEPYNLGGKEYNNTANNTVYADWAKDAIKERFKYLRHMYTCQLKVHREGGTCFDPLLFHYPHDDEVFKTDNTEHSFIIGDALKITPVLDWGVTDVMSYFPTGRWVDMKSFGPTYLVNSNGSLPAQGEWKKLDVFKGVNVHLRPGHIVPLSANNDANTTTDYRGSEQLSLIANRDVQGFAQGYLFMDADDSLSALENENYEYYQFILSANSIKKINLNTKNGGPKGEGIDSIIISDAADLNETDFACWTSDSDHTSTELKATYDVNLQNLKIATTTGEPIQFYHVKNIYYGNSKKDLNLCGEIIANGTHYDKQYYKVDAAPNLNASTAQITLKAAVANNSNTPDLIMKMAVLQTLNKNGKEPIDILNIEWEYANKSIDVRAPYAIPVEIAGADKSAQSEQGVLSDWINFSQDKVLGSFEIQVQNEKIFFTLTSDMSFGEYINVINGKANVYTGVNGDSFKGVMGLSQQSTSNLFLADGMYSLWTRDQVDPQQTVQDPNQNSYNTHPYIFGKETEDSWFGVFINNAAAQDWWIKNNYTTGQVDIKVMATGGIGDMYFFTAKNPVELTQAFHRIVGTPVVTPQWALGWHQSQQGYKNTADIKKVVDGYFENSFPLEVVWADIDYMSDYKDFTVDQKNFGDLGTYLQGIKDDNSIKFIPIVEVGIAQRTPTVDNYTAYNDGVDQDVFIYSGAPNKYNYQVKQFTGQTWAGDAAFVDFTATNSSLYWNTQLSNLFVNLQYQIDGLWLNSNEAQNFQCNGVCYQDQKATNPVQWNLPYIPTGRNLETKALPLDATHKDGVMELDVHSLYGTQQTMATHKWFVERKVRTMIIERSSYSGSGKYGSMWLGNNYSSGPYMGYSVTGTMLHNIAGIPLSGADICGSIGDSNAELCARWYTVGAFYPFSRNHNSIGNIPQLPWSFTGVYERGLTYHDIFMNAMLTKLHLIRYYYTQMSLVQESGGAFYRPLFFDFPNDDYAYLNQELNVMLGPALKLGIQSTHGVPLTPFYYPAGRYCSVFCKFETDCCKEYVNGTEVVLPSYAFNFYLDLLAGHIIPMQNATAIANLHGPGDKVQLNTAVLQNHTVEIHLMPLCINDTVIKPVCRAVGEYINDDGLTTDLSMRKNFQFVYSHNISATPGAAPDSMVINITSQGPIDTINANDLLGGIQIYDYTNLNFTGAEYTVTQLALDNNNFYISTVVGTTVFSISDDRLVWSGHGKQQIDNDLRRIKSITFNKNK